MNRLPRFKFLRPHTLTEATQLLHENEGEAVALAGGTDLLVRMKYGLLKPTYVIGLQQLPELGIFRDRKNESFEIGAGATLQSLVNSSKIQTDYPVLAEAAESIGTPQVRHMGTVGGNLCLDTRCLFYNQSYFWRKAIGFCLKEGAETCRIAPGSARCLAVSSSDAAPALQALDATLEIHSHSRTRIVSANRFFNEDGMQHLNLQSGEILSKVSLPPPQKGQFSTYRKYRVRESFDFPEASVAVSLTLDSGTCKDAHIVIGGIESRPQEVTSAAEVLLSESLESSTIKKCASEAEEISKPVPNAFSDTFYRKKMVGTMLTQALQDLAERSAHQRST